MRGNPAISLVHTIYFKRPWHDDFSLADPHSQADLVHELTHILQYEKLGVVAFAWRYARELAAVGFRPGRLYDYRSAGTKFSHATLEGQAQMVGDYCEAKLRRDKAALAAIAPWLEGSGLFEF
jgi:hypothetical protein